MDRITQPSTWAGIAGLLQVLVGFFPAYAGLFHAASAAAAAGAVALNEKGAQ